MIVMEMGDKNSVNILERQRIDQPAPPPQQTEPVTQNRIRQNSLAVHVDQHRGVADVG